MRLPHPKSAVKKYHQSKQPEWGLDFLHIVEVMSHIRHRNISHVIGCCVEKDHQLLVTEYADNGSVAELLQDPRRKNSSSTCIGELPSALELQGLCYLHEDANPHVIHREVRDSNFTPKITNFDIVDFFSDSDELPHEAAVVGTAVYLDPEYCATRQYTEKVDVYAFGVVMLEIISGRNVIDMQLDFDDQLITGWVSKLVKDGRVLEMVDPALRDYPIDDVVLMLHGVCSSCRHVLTGRSIEASTGKGKTEDLGESLVLQGILNLKDDESADIATDSRTRRSKFG